MFFFHTTLFTDQKKGKTNHPHPLGIQSNPRCATTKLPYFPLSITYNCCLIGILYNWVAFPPPQKKLGSISITSPINKSPKQPLGPIFFIAQVNCFKELAKAYRLGRSPLGVSSFRNSFLAGFKNNRFREEISEWFLGALIDLDIYVICILDIFIFFKKIYTLIFPYDWKICSLNCVTIDPTLL